MENKKNLKALLEARKNKKQQKKNKQDTSSALKEDEDVPKADGSATKADTPIEEETAAMPASKKTKDGDDDSSDDEFRYKIETKVQIVDKQADSSQKQDVVEVPDYMKQKDPSDDLSKDGSKQKQKRADGSAINFGGGKPTFGRRPKAGVLGDDFQELADLDDDGKQKKNQKRGGDGLHNAGDKNRKQEEEKSTEIKAGPRKPTFTGKAKIGGGASTEQTGTNVQYDFGVKYKTNGPDDGRKGQQDGKKGDGGDGHTEVRKDKRKINQGRFGGKDAALDDQDLDEGFEIVKDPNQKRRQQRATNRNRDDDDFSRKNDGDRKDPAIKRGGAFGNLGGKDSD